MAIQRMDHVVLVVEELAKAVAYFEALGLTAGGRMPISGTWVDRINSLDGVRVEIVMMQTPDGHSQLELTEFEHPKAQRVAPEHERPNTLGLRSVMFAVDDLDATVARVKPHGGTLIGTIENYEDVYRLCYLRGPGGSIVALAQALR